MNTPDTTKAFAHATAEALRKQATPLLSTSTPPKILVALSGGPDSSALLLALHQTMPDSLAGAAHFHHGLRGADADADAAFCAQLCAERNIPCVIALGKVQAAGRSPQDAARRDRYAFLIETAQELGANLIAVAHTADDQAETVLGRVLRGTSIDGLAGIAPTRPLAPGIYLVRPTISLSRAGVEVFCEANRITPRQDPTNRGTKYVRSRLRQRMPEIARDFNPRLGDALRRLAENARTDSDLLTTLADQLWQVAALPGPPVLLDRPQLIDAHPSLLRRVLFRAIIATYADEEDTTILEEAATFAFAERLEQLVRKGSGAVSLPGGNLAARMTGEYLVFERDTKTTEYAAPFSAPLPIPGSTTVEAIHLTIQAQRDSLTAKITSLYRVHMDSAAIPHAGLIIRSPRPSDRIAPFGMHGKTKSVRDVCADAKVPVSQRNSIPLVVRADDPETILWIVGQMQSELTRITPATQEVITLTANWDANPTE